MKNFLIVIILLFTVAAYSQNFGYVLTINNSKETAATQSFKTPSIDEAQKTILANTGLNLDLEKIFTGENVFFEYRNRGLLLYCEKKEIEKRSDGKIIYRKIRQKGEKAIEIFADDEQIVQGLINTGELPKHKDNGLESKTK